LWLNKIFLIQNSQNRRNLSLFIVCLVIIPFVLMYHINYVTKIDLVEWLKQKLLQNIGLFFHFRNAEYSKLYSFSFSASNRILKLCFKLSIIVQKQNVIHRWAHTASSLSSDANFFICALAVPLTSQNVNGLVIEAKFLANPLAVT